jgi:hypothetical protein
MVPSDLRTCPLLLAAAMLAASAIGGGLAAEEAAIAGRATTKVGKPIAPRNLLGRRTTQPATTQHIQPNAIGVWVDRQRHEGETRGMMSGVNSPGAVVSGTSGAGFARQGPGLQSSSHLQFHTMPTVTPVVPSRPVISGTGAARPGSVPGAIGGPARTVVGVSGTAIRAKH